MHMIVPEPILERKSKEGTYAIGESIGILFGNIWDPEVLAVARNSDVWCGTGAKCRYHRYNPVDGLCVDCLSERPK